MLLTAFVSISIQEMVYVIQAVFYVEDLTDLFASFSSTFLICQFVRLLEYEFIVPIEVTVFYVKVGASGWGRVGF